MSAPKAWLLGSAALAFVAVAVIACGDGESPAAPTANSVATDALPTATVSATATSVATDVGASSDLPRPPTTADVAEYLSRQNEIPASWHTYEDQFYGLSLRYPPAWQIQPVAAVTEPHGITVYLPEQTDDEELDREKGGVYPAARLGIQPFLERPVSDARCVEPVLIEFKGRQAAICTYRQGETYENIAFFPNEWSVISVTLHTDLGPMYLTGAVTAPFTPGGDLDVSAPELAANAESILLILSTLEIEEVAPR